MVMLSRASDEAIRAAHEKHRAARAPVAPVQVRNAQALVALGEHRPLRWRGHAYRVPPVPFRAGARLLVVSQVIVQAAAGGGREGERALSIGRGVMHTLVQRRRFGRWGKPRRNPFRDATAAEALALIDWFLDVPDETPTFPGARPGMVDFMDGLLEFTHLFPALMRPDGLPVSWAHYQHGLRHIGRARARDEFRFAQATRVGTNAPADKWKSYEAAMRRAGGLN